MFVPVVPISIFSAHDPGQGRATTSGRAGIETYFSGRSKLPRPGFSHWRDHVGEYPFYFWKDRRIVATVNPGEDLIDLIVEPVTVLSH